MGNAITKIDGNGNTTTNEYDKMNNLIKETNPKGGISTYTYDYIGRLTEQTTPNNYQTNNKTKYVYDKYDNLVDKTITYTENEQTIEIKTLYEYDLANNLTKQTDPENKVTTYEYNLAGQLTKQTDANNNMTTYEYDTLNNLIKEINAKGVITNYTYDQRGNLLQTSIKPGENVEVIVIEQNEYDLLNNKTKATDARGAVTNYEYDLNNQLIKETLPNLYETAYTYNGKGQTIKSLDSLGKEQIFIYDVYGNTVTTIERKSDETQSITTSAVYDKNGNKTQETDGNGNITKYEYDANNNLVKTTNTKNQITTYEYDANNNLIKEINFIGNSKIYSYDAMDRLIEEKNELGEVIEQLEYDKNSRQTKSIDALGKIVQYVYDNVGNIVQEIDQEGNAIIYTYDSLNNKLTKTDKNGKITTYEYDYANNLIKTTTPLNEITQYEYDKNNNLVKITDAKNQVIEYQYDVLNNEVSEKDALGNMEIKTYTLDGMVASLTTRKGDVIEYEYDIHGRLVKETIGTDITQYTYDNNGNITQITKGEDITTQTYDELNRLTQKTEQGLQTIYGYDILNEETQTIIEKIIYPNTNEVLKEFDKAGRLIKVIDGTDITIYEYNLDGTTKKLTYSNGATEEYEYNNDKTLFKLTNTNGETIEVYTYTYDANNNILQKTDTKGTTTYTYDELNRLKTVQTPEEITTYEYDVVGNRTKEIIGTKTKEYEYNAKNQLVRLIEKENNIQTKETTYTYDLNGNQTEVKENGETVQTNTYNARNQLIGTTKDEQTTAYMYDIEGKRISKQTETGTTKFVYDGNKVILELNANNVEMAKNVYGLALISRQVGETKGYYLYNGHGDVEKIISTDGTVLNSYYYDEYGNIEEETETINNPYKYAGYYYDSETGNYYLESRYYNPVTGTFTSEDTYRGEIDDPLSLNRYIYVRHNPVIYTDPNGHIPIPVITGRLGAILATGAEFISDFVDDGQINRGIKSYIGTAIEGAIVGGTLGQVGLSGGMLKLVGTAFVSQTLGNATNQIISTGTIDTKQAITSGITTAVGTATFGTGGNVTSTGLKWVLNYAGKGALTGATTNATYQLLTKGEIDIKEVAFATATGTVAAPVVAKVTTFAIDKLGNVNTFPNNPYDFKPKNLEMRTFKNGEIIKWFETKSNKALYEWNYDSKFGSHYHVTPNRKR